MLALALVFHVVTAGLWALYCGFPHSFDELQHYSYVRLMEAAPAIFPRFENLRTLAPDLSGWAEANYLNHPSPYYLLMALVDAPLKSILVSRLVNVALSTAGLALMLLTGLRLLGEVRERMIFAAMVVLFPKVGMIGGIVNNDNAALLASGVFFFALAKWREKRGGWLMALAFALTGWTKFTVFLMAGFAFAIFVLLRRERPARAHLVAALGGLIGAIPTIANLIMYGEPLWRPSYFFVPLAKRVPIDFPTYVHLFAVQMPAKWPAMDGLSIIGATSLFAVLALAAVVVTRRGPEWTLAKAMILALVPILLLHLWFGWRQVVQDGYLNAAQTRYYYALWPGFALGIVQLSALPAPSILRTGVTTLTLAALLGCSALWPMLHAMVVGTTLR